MNIGRATLIAVAAVVLTAAALATDAQPAGKTWHLGFLGDGSAAARATNTLNPLRDSLRTLGYLEGKNLLITSRWSDGKNERLAELARELARLDVDVIVTHGVPAGHAVKAATTSIPIVVAAAADMVDAGLVASLPRPGGNVTGFSDQVAELGAKEVQILREMRPRAKLVAILWNRGNPGAVRSARATRTAARDAGLQIRSLEVEAPGDVDKAFDAAARDRVDAVIVVHDTMTVGRRLHIAELALKKRLPTISASVLFADAGGLMNYGPDQVELFKRSAILVDKILKGAKPADIPVEQPTRFEFAINLKTAKALGLTVPPSVLLRADRVIE